ncbi:Hypothetical predicted protein [Marmota monax]|uniref:Uncharacterized protein n=1 Tax=Marmota monax TaxID=9995 RepID=A0A5E4BCV0_MARMO|nr:hypothetical protein GHT09_000490 [Marmota monax]VTJ66442.1 Hypothetical predicted protein [Marmota monax]
MSTDESTMFTLLCSGEKPLQREERRGSRSHGLPSCHPAACFGMVHDGEGNMCKKSEGNIMSPTLAGRNGVFSWSPCSRQYLHKFLRYEHLHQLCHLPAPLVVTPCSASCACSLGGFAGLGSSQGILRFS